MYRGALADAVLAFEGKANDCRQIAKDTDARAAAKWAQYDMVQSEAQKQSILSAWGEHVRRAEQERATANAFSVASFDLQQRLARIDETYAAQLRAELQTLFPDSPARWLNN